MDADRLRWRKSSVSGNEGCVEVGLDSDVVALRDTKDREGGRLVLSETAWREFVNCMVMPRGQVATGHR